MRATPGTLREGGAPFATTHWSVVAASALDNDAAQAALTQLCQDYWPPLYSFVRRRGYTPEDAQDMVQGFFAYLLETKTHARAERARGKFRSFLLAALKHYLADTWDRERAHKRGGGYQVVLLDEEIGAIEAMQANESALTRLDEEQSYNRHWATSLVSHALERLRKESSVGAKERMFDRLKPFLAGGVGLPAHEEVAAQLGMPVETLRSQLARFRARYRLFLREEVARTISPVDDVDEELSHLRNILTTAL